MKKGFKILLHFFLIPLLFGAGTALFLLNINPDVEFSAMILFACIVYLVYCYIWLRIHKIPIPPIKDDPDEWLYEKDVF